MSQVSIPQSQPARNNAAGTRSFLLVASGFVLALALVGAATASRAVISPAPMTSSSFTSTVDGATAANVRLEFGAGNLTIGALDGRPGTLATMDFEGPSNEHPDASYRVRNGVGELAYLVGNEGPRINMPFFGRSRDHSEMRVQLAQGVPLALDIRAGAANSTIDLTALRVHPGQTGNGCRRYRRAASGERRIDHGERHGWHLRPDVRGAERPRGDMQLSGGMTSRQIDLTRFRSLGDGHFRSPDFETATNRAVLNVELGMATITIR